MYSVIINRADNKNPQTVDVCYNLASAMESLENYVLDFLILKEGQNRAARKVQREPTGGVNSRTWYKMPFGYFATRNAQHSLYGVTIWNKQETIGWLWNSFVIDRIFDIEICHIPKKYIVAQPMDSVGQALFHEPCSKEMINLDMCFADTYASFMKNVFEELKAKVNVIV